jgi:hypothetical protein
MDAAEVGEGHADALRGKAHPFDPRGAVASRLGRSRRTVPPKGPGTRRQGGLYGPV